MDSSHLSSGAPDFSQGAPTDSSPLSQSARQLNRFHEELDDKPLGSSAPEHGIERSNSTISQSHTLTPSRGGTLKKKQSLKKSGSLRRSSSRRSLGAGSVKSIALGEREKYVGREGEDIYSAFFTPVPTSGSPTEILANRFQAWRKVLKDLITYYRDVQKTYDARSKSLISISNVINNTSIPGVFLTEGGIGDAMHVLRDYHKKALAEGNKARTVEEDVIVQLTGLRSDLQQKIKEIKNLGGDFKNNVDKETEGTRKAVRNLQEALGLVDTDPSATSGKNDPYVVRLGVERQIERQIEEENYLHRAFLNLENSGRELESIVVGEIQKAHNAYAGILKREADEAYEAVDALRSGPIAMAKDHEWDAFVDNNEHFVDPRLPIRKPEHINYPGKEDPAASEVRAGMLERKSKYLKSYSPGWYVLSPMHLHEFKSPDRISSQTPVMSLYLPEQKLGSQSGSESSSHKFMLKGRQTGGMHRGHGWVFRAESRDTMLAWYEDIKSLTEKRGEERKAFVRQHARSVSAGSHKAGSISSDGAMDEDEADAVPYSATASQIEPEPEELKLQERPQPGGRFPSDLNVNRDLRVPLSPSSGTSSDERDVIAAAGALPGSDVRYGKARDEPRRIEDDTYFRYESQRESYVPIAHTQEYNSLPVRDGPNPATMQQTDQSHQPNRTNPSISSGAQAPGLHGNEYNSQPVQSHGISSDEQGSVAYGASPPEQSQYAKPAPKYPSSKPERQDSHYGEWMAPTAVGVGAGAADSEVYQKQRDGTSALQPQPKSQPSVDSAMQQRVTEIMSPPSQPGTTTTNATPVDKPKSSNLEAVDIPAKTGAKAFASGHAVGPLSSRPGMATQPSEASLASLTSLTSLQTIGHLHVPGEYPHGTPTSPVPP